MLDNDSDNELLFLLFMTVVSIQCAYAISFNV